jgi:hypothetical protein
VTLFIKLENDLPTGHPIAEENFRQLFPEVSFPRFYTADSVEQFGYGIYDYSNCPEPEGYKKAVEVAPVKNEFGIWKQSWEIIDMTQEERQAHDQKIKNKEISKINIEFLKEIESVKAGYTEDEIKSWPQQITEAQAYQADQTVSTPLLDAIVSQRGGTKDELVLRIATNATQYAQVFGVALGKKQKAIADLG